MMCHYASVRVEELIWHKLVAGCDSALHSSKYFILSSISFLTYISFPSITTINISASILFSMNSFLKTQPVKEGGLTICILFLKKPQFIYPFIPIYFYLLTDSSRDDTFWLLNHQKMKRLSCNVSWCFSDGFLSSEI